MKKIAFLMCSLLLAPNLQGAGKKEDDQTNTSNHIELAPDAGIYKGMIIDSGHPTQVTKISFAGETVIDGIKKEHDNSSNRVSLADIASIEVLDSKHKSRRYPKQSLCRAAVHTTKGMVEELLFPRHLLICAQSEESNIKKSWELHLLDGISIRHGIADPVISTDAHQIMYPAAE